MGVRILVVDDDPSSVKLISNFLRKEGFEVTGPFDGAKAIELIENSQFDLVVSDVRMPHLDGVALAMYVRSMDPTLPIILMTVVPSDITPKLYNVPCLSKPLSLGDLKSNIERLL
jgi:two-component system, OmpR family, alkaline phosphatase synthesis response regulator PhoP